MNALQTLASVLAMTSTASVRRSAVGAHVGPARADRIRYVGRQTVDFIDGWAKTDAIAKRARKAVRNLRDLPQAQP